MTLDPMTPNFFDPKFFVKMGIYPSNWAGLDLEPLKRAKGKIDGFYVADDALLIRSTALFGMSSGIR